MHQLVAVVLAHATLGQRLKAAGHVLGQAASTSAETMGTTLFAVGAGILFFILRAIRTYRREGRAAMQAHLGGDAGYGLALAVSLWLVLTAWNVTTVISDDHRTMLSRLAAVSSDNARLRAQLAKSTRQAEQTLLAERQALQHRNSQLEAELFERTHNLSATTPAFSNVREVIDAFRTWRATIGQSAPCRVVVSAPPSAADIAMTTAQVAVIGSNCPTFGPFDANLDPDAEKQALNGMVQRTVVIHMAKGVKGDVPLYNALQNVFLVKRSYDVPAGSPENFVWLQFGAGTKWNSQLRN